MKIVKKYLVLDIDIFTKELESHFTTALSESGPVCVLTGEDVKDILHKSHVENVKILESRASKKEESADLDSLIDSRKWRRYYR